MASFFYIFFIFGVHGPPPMRQLDFGLWARFSPRFCPTLHPRSLFSTGPRFPIPKQVTSGFSHFRFRWRHFRSCDFRSHENEAPSKRGHHIKTRPIFPYGPDLLLESDQSRLLPKSTGDCFFLHMPPCGWHIFVLLITPNCRVALSHNTKINSKPLNKRSQEFQMLSKINKSTTSPSLRSVRYSVLELFAKTFHGNL